jgi:hypothetical protein
MQGRLQMASKKVRFLALNGGQPRQLLSVSEASDGGLTLALKGGINFEQSEGDIPIIENRISVHTSPKSAGRIIKRTVLLKSGKKMTSAVFVRPPKHDFRQYIMSTACSDLTGISHDVDVKGSDSVKVAAWECPADATLIFHIFVGSKHQAFDELPATNLIKHSFRVFELAVYVNYLNRPASFHSQNITIATSAPQENGVPQGKSYSGNGLPSLKLDQVEKVIWHANDTLAHQKAVRTSLSIGSLFNIYKGHVPVFSKFPISDKHPATMIPANSGSIDWGSTKSS